jgi:hypothetical protein
MTLKHLIGVCARTYNAFITYADSCNTPMDTCGSEYYYSLLKSGENTVAQTGQVGAILLTDLLTVRSSVEAPLIFLMHFLGLPSVPILSHVQTRNNFDPSCYSELCFHRYIWYLNFILLLKFHPLTPTTAVSAVAFVQIQRQTKTKEGIFDDTTVANWNLGFIAFSLLTTAISTGLCRGGLTL